MLRQTLPHLLSMQCIWPLICSCTMTSLQVLSLQLFACAALNLCSCSLTHDTCWLLLLLPRGGDLPCPDLTVRSMHVWWLVGVLDRCWSELPNTAPLDPPVSSLVLAVTDIPGWVMTCYISYHTMPWPLHIPCILWVAVCQ